MFSVFISSPNFFVLHLTKYSWANIEATRVFIWNPYHWLTPMLSSWSNFLRKTWIGPLWLTRPAPLTQTMGRNSWGMIARVSHKLNNFQTMIWSISSIGNQRRKRAVTASWTSPQKQGNLVWQIQCWDVPGRDINEGHQGGRMCRACSGAREDVLSVSIGSWRGERKIV